MKELYRITGGKLFCEEQSNEFTFGFIYDDNGRFNIEIYLHTDQNEILTKYWLDNSTPSEIGNFRIEGRTVKGDKIYLYDLYPTGYSTSDPAVAKFRCYDKLVYERPPLDRPRNGIQKEPEKIYYIELEGLKLEHSGITKKEIHRANSHRNLKDTFDNRERDHTTFAINFIDKVSYLTHDGEFYNHPASGNENIVLEFKNHVTKEIFDLNKEYLVQFLSFINGGNVRIRRIYTGDFLSYTKKELGAQIVETYSFQKINNEFVSKYIPISSAWHRSDHALGISFLRYEDFIKEYDSLDFRSTIFYLNRANKNDNPEQKVFTLLVALEELGSKYRQLNNTKDKTIIPPSDFETIKKALKQTLAQFKSSISNKNYEYNDLLSKLCDINTRKQDTDEKFYELFKYGGIKRTSEIEQLVTQRHFAIHEGDIGKTGKDKWLFYFRLDHLLRDIILNRIGYDGVRNQHHIFRDITQNQKENT